MCLTEDSGLLTSSLNVKINALCAGGEREG